MTELLLEDEAGEEEAGTELVRDSELALDAERADDDDAVWETDVELAEVVVE